jgi:NAD(P)-dependent dehydrogenase (short-subunit alcohol dehydrogenase family)
MRDLKGRTAIITGGASGIGRGTALALAARGVNVLVADVDAEGGEAAAEAVSAAGAEGLFARFDAGATPYETLRDAAMRRFGRVDIVMNNVGVLTNGLPENIPLEEWRRIFELNLFSLVRSNLVFVPHFKAQGFGHFVNTASFAGLYTYAFDRQPYAASKAAVVQISEGLAIYLRPFGVHVTVLCPGPVKTNISASVRAFGPRAEMRTPGPQFRLMEPSEVGEQVVQAIEAERFMLPTHEAVKAILIERARDWDGYLQAQIDRPSIVAPPKP